MGLYTDRRIPIYLDREGPVSLWVSVYCKKRVGTLRPAQLVAAVRERLPKFSYLFAVEDPEETARTLRFEKVSKGREAPLYHLRYLDDPPPIVIDKVTAKATVAGYVEEYLEEFFRGRRGKQATAVRKHLAATVEIVNFCLKQSHYDGMGLPVTYAAAAWLCELGDGLTRTEEGWLRLTRGQLTIIVRGE